MVDQKPDGITTEDWAETPSPVRRLITRLLQQQTISPGTLMFKMSLAQSGLSNEDAVVNGPVVHQAEVLVVDDNEMNRDMLSRRLSRQGHNVSMAVNGREALEMLEVYEYDLVLLDIMMPEINGYEVLEQLKHDPQRAHIPVIMITAVDETESLIRCIQLGAEDYLPKPFNPVLLKARVDTSLEKKWLRDQQVAYTQQLDLENQRKSGELEQARQIQLSMLPTKPPVTPFLDIAARQDTASEVGGDYYDFFTLPDQSLRVVIGDATGHGVASGLMVSMTKASLLSNDEQDLPTLLQQINVTLTNIDLGTQLNMALLLLEFTCLQDGSVQVRASGGGMPPLYILRADQDFQEILISGLPLGIVREAYYQKIDFTLQRGDTLLLASDGLPERFNVTREILGFNRLESALAQINTANLTAAQILDQIAKISDNWGNTYPIHDDVTLVVLKVQ